MRALTLIGAVLCGLVFSACYEHAEPVIATPQPLATAEDSPGLDRVAGDQGPVVFRHGGHMGYGFACTDCHHTVEAGGYPTEGCIGCHVPPADDDPAHGGPDDNVVLVGDTQDMGRLPGVPFNHFTHASDQGFELACTSCHHIGPNIACDSCHGPVATMTIEGDAVVPRLKRALHLQCKGCHDALLDNDPESIAPVDCDSCHTDVELSRLEGALSFERAQHLSCIGCHRDVQDERGNAPTNCGGCHVSAEEVAAYAVRIAEAEAAALAAAETCEADPASCEGGEGEDTSADGDAAVDDGPGPVTWAGEAGDVTFQHDTHTEPGCETCHPEPYPMSSESLGEEAGHAACATCHGAELEEETCDKCHVTP